MSCGFWKTLPKPILGLSPMDGVTDAAFRQMVARYGQPDVMFTEFVPVEGMFRVVGEGVDRLYKAFRYDENERPVVAQVFGKTPERFYQAAVVVSHLGFDGMDINMGCPAKNVAEHGAGAGLIATPELAQEIVVKAKQGMRDYLSGKVSLEDLDMQPEAQSWVEAHGRESKGGGECPVSVKTRLGTGKSVVREWIPALLEVEPAAITIHGRTLKQLYSGEADWEAIAEAAEIIHGKGGLILGNGDVKSLRDAQAKVREYGVDGVLIGRAALGNPGIFAGVLPMRRKRVQWMREHVGLYQNYTSKDYIVPMRKHLSWYCRGFAGAGDLRSQLMRCSTASEVGTLLA